MSTKANVKEIDLQEISLRKTNVALQEHNGKSDNDIAYRVLNPKGAHAVACGLDSPISVEIDGNVGYYCAGMNKSANVVIKGSAGQGVAENMMSGMVHVEGDTSQSAGATAHGGLLVVDGNASGRCGISLKGGDIVVKGNVGHMSMFMAQAGNLVVLGKAGEALGDSIYEAEIFVRGPVDSLGADCIEKDMEPEHTERLRNLLDRAGCTDVQTSEFKRYGSARQLYNFKIENVDAY